LVLVVGNCVQRSNNRLLTGNATYNAAPRLTESFSVAGAGQIVSFTSSPGKASVGGPTYTPVASSSAPGLLVTISSTTASVCTYSGVDVSFVAVGTCTLQASQAGSSQYLANSTQQSFQVEKGLQSITFNSPAPQGAVVLGAGYVVSAVSSAGLQVTLSIPGSSSTVCSLSSNTVNFLSTGSCTVNADASGNGNYQAAPQGSQTFTVFRGTQTVNFVTSAPAAAVVAGTTYTPGATSSITGVSPVLTVTGGSLSVCVMDVQTGVVSFIGAGSCSIAANSGATADFNAAVEVLQTFNVGKGSQVRRRERC
jgi:hypothetical protein